MPGQGNFEALIAKLADQAFRRSLCRHWLIITTG
jgi:hypothetical protein